MVFRRSRGMAIRPVQRIKHVRDSSATLAAAAIFSDELVSATDTPVISGTNNVITGAIVNGIYLKVEVAANENIADAIPNVYMYVAKNPGTNLTLPAPNAVGANDNKKFIIHQEMIMIENVKGGNPRVLFNGVIAIPKGYRRFGPDDALELKILSPSIDIALCFQCHYKEFR